VISAIGLALSILEAVLSSAKANNLAVEIVQGVEAAVAALVKVRNTPVSFGQLEGLRVQTKW
jgi:hypothetical protein